MYLEGDRIEVPILSEAAYLIQQKGSWSIRLPYLLYSPDTKEITVNKMMRIAHRKQKTAAYLCFMDGDESWKTYRRYSYPSHRFTIGSSRDDDICTAHAFIGPSQYVIDPDSRMISASNGGLIYVGSHACSGQCTYEPGDVLECFGLRIVFHKKFMMINCTAGLHHHLNLYANERSYRPCSDDTYHLVNEPYVIPEARTEVKIEEAPMISEDRGRSLLFSIGPSLMMSSASLSSGIMSVYLGYMNGREIIELLPMVMLPGIMLLSTLLWNPLQIISDRRKKKKETEERNSCYQQDLWDLLAGINEFSASYRETMNSLFPDSYRLYERLSESDNLCTLDSDQIMLRIGTSSQLLEIDVNEPKGIRMNDETIRRMVNDFRDLAQAPYEVPAVISLNQYPHVVIDDDAMHLCEYLIGQIAFGYESCDVGIAVLCTRQFLEENRWLLDVPHIYTDSDLRMILCDMGDISELMNLCASDSRRLICFNLINAEIRTDVFMCEIRFPQRAEQVRCDLRVNIEKDGWIVHDFIFRKKYSLCIEDKPAKLAPCFHRLPLRLTDRKITGGFSFLEMYGCTSVMQLEIQERWGSSQINTSIQALLGCTGKGEDIILDLHEKRDGPHGLIAGTTGSGKSELILTMILSLAVSYSPKDLQFLLIDFKGGSSLNSLTNKDHRLPHVTGTLSNLDAEDMERVLVQFGLECRSREALLRSMSMVTGKPVMNVSDYRRMWTKDSNLPYPCELVIIVDEFAELKKEQPEFLNELISIARVGRSLGIHLILSTQKPAGVVTDQIWSNSKFKICLKVSEKQDSQEMIHCHDASFIRDPGCFYLLSEDRLSYGRSGYVQAGYSENSQSVVLYDMMHRIYADSARDLPKGEPEINLIIDAVNDVYSSHEKVGPLWKPPLSTVAWDDVQSPLAFALIDDYFNNKTIPLCLQEGFVHGFISSDLKERIHLTMNLLYAIFRDIKNDDEVFVIDDLSALSETNAMKAPQLIDVFASDDTDRCRSFYDLLEKRKNSNTRTFVIINDISRHYEENGDYRARLMKLAERSGQYNLCLVLCAGGSGSFSYREMSHLTHKYCLRTSSVQEVQSFMMTSAKTIVSKKHHGFAGNGPLLSFGLCETDEKLLNAAAAKLEIEYGTEKRTFLPHMPETISSKDCTEEGIPLGILRRNYRWLSLKQNEKLCVTASDENILDAFTEYLGKFESDIDTVFPSAKRVTAVLTDQLTSFDSREYSDVYFLFLKDAFRSQYRVHTSLKPVSGESILYHRGRTEVIRTAEE